MIEKSSSVTGRDRPTPLATSADRRPTPRPRRRLPLAIAAAAVLGVGALLSAGTVDALAAATRTSTIPTTTTPSLNAASDHLALTAYKTYIQALVLNARLGRQRDAALVSTVASSCQNALSQLNGEPSTPVRQAVLSNFGEEIGDDLALAFQSAARRAFAQLSTALGALQWSYHAPVYAIRQLLSAERSVLKMPQSNLCADASQVSTNPRVIPVATQTFLSRYLAASDNVSRRFTAFLTVLQRHETTADHPLVAEIDSLVAQYGAALASGEQTYSQSIMSDLGVVS